MPVEILRRRRTGFTLRDLRRDAERLLIAARRPRATLSILLTDDDEIRDLNRRFRGKDRPTDVLSFPTEGNDLLGDVVISLDTALRQAREHRHDLFTEVRILLAHGLLHLCGYDHVQGSAAARKMRRAETRILEAIGVVRGPLTGRDDG